MLVTFCASLWLRSVRISGVFFLGSQVGGEHTLSQTYCLRRDFDELIIGDELQRLFQRQLLRRHEAHRFISRRSSPVGELLFFVCIDAEDYIAAIFTTVHA